MLFDPVAFGGGVRARKPLNLPQAGRLIAASERKECVEFRRGIPAADCVRTRRVKKLA